MHRRSVLLLIMVATVCAGPGNDARAAGQVAKTGHPDPSLAISRIRDSADRTTRLVIRRAGVEVGSLVLPADVARTAIDAGLEAIVWHPNGRDFAGAFARAKGSFVAVFLAQADGTYRAIDVSQVEAANIGAIGPFRAYREIRSRPVDWIPRDDDSVQVRLRTDAWDTAGVHYRMHEPLIITRAGEPLWR